MRTIFNCSHYMILLAALLPGSVASGQSDSLSPWGRIEPNAPSFNRDDGDQSPLVQGIQFENNDISMVFQMVSDLTGWSIFPTEEVAKAKVSLWARGITAKKVLDRAVAMAGFIYHQEGEIVTVMTYDEYTQFYGLEKRVISLGYANANSVDSVIKPFLTDLGKSVVHKETNTLVLFESDANLETICGIIQRLDVPFEAEMSLEVINLRYMDAVVMAETLEKVFSDGKTDQDRSLPKAGAASPGAAQRITEPNTPGGNALSPPQARVGIYSVARTNQLIVKAQRREIQGLKALVEKLDTYVEPTTKSYHFTYVDAAEIYTGLEQILDIPTRTGSYGRSRDGRTGQETARPGGITLVGKTNSILLTAPPSVHRVMTSIVETIDVPSIYEAGVIRVYKIDNADINEIAVAIRDLLTTTDEQRTRTGEPKYAQQPSQSDRGGQTPQESPGSDQLRETEEYVPQIEARVAVSKATNSVIVQATARQHRELEKLIEELDRQRKQVLIKAMIIEVSTVDDVDLGVELNYAGNSALAFTSFGLSSIDPVSGARDIMVSPGGTAAVLEPDDVQAILHALESNDNIRITSAPQVLVNDNAIGSIVSIAEEPTSQTNQGETTTTTSFAGFVEAGTQFKITPHISESDYLRVEYAITLNAFGEKATAVLPPSRSTTEITSEATVPDGHTIVVGGLQSSNESESTDKVPFLGDLPVIGLAFRSTITRKQHITTYLFITTTIMRSEDFADLKEISREALEASRNDVKSEEPEQTTDDAEQP